MKCDICGRKVICDQEKHKEYEEAEINKESEDSADRGGCEK